MPRVRFLAAISAALLAGSLATASPSAAEPPHLGAYIVQFADTISDAQRAELRGLGARLGPYVSDHAYVTRMTSATVRAVQALGFVRSVGSYAPADKLDPGSALVALSGDAQYLITLIERSPSDQKAVARRISALGGRLDVISESGRDVLATLNPSAVAAVTRLPEVLSVGAVSARRPT